MSQNPFDALGGGGLDMNALLQQAQQMQEQLTQAQARLADTVVEGTVAGGAVTVKVNGVGELVGVDIRAGVQLAGVRTAADGVVIDIAGAAAPLEAQADAAAGEALGPLAGGLGDLGGGMGGGLPGGTPGQLGF
jgi:DNA-binding protein YbaB